VSRQPAYLHRYGWRIADDHVNIIGDTIVEGDEAFTITLGAVTPA